MVNNTGLEKPKKVGLAVNLLYTVIALGVIRATVNIIRHIDVRSIGYMHFGHALFLIASGYLVYLVNKRHNWARITLLIILILEIPVSILPIFDSISHSVLANLIGLIQVILFTVAMVQLFSQESRAWFNRD